MGLWNWEKLRTEIMEYGVYNSLFLALMPTASTAQILGNNEAIEAFTSNIYSRRTLAGEFMVVNKYLIKDLIDIGIGRIPVTTVEDAEAFVDKILAYNNINSYGEWKIR